MVCYQNETMTRKKVIVVGAGVAGLTATAVLAHEGLDVTLFESHDEVGGCAGTFLRGKYIFDVGATQVAGLEKGGIHERIFRYLKVPLPVAEILNPACEIDLQDGTPPIRLWHDLERWVKERHTQFPGSESFWSLCSLLHNLNWTFAQKDPILPIANYWDLQQFLRAFSPLNCFSGLFSKASVVDLLRICSCDKDHRLKKFLDLQLKLYSQELSDHTSALYGATVLQMAQSPLGLWHLQGSMQALSNTLKASLLRDGAQLRLKNKVVGLARKPTEKNYWSLDVVNSRNLIDKYSASDVVFSLPPQCLLNLVQEESDMPESYRKQLEQLPKPSGAIVFYGALSRQYLKNIHASHLQCSAPDFGSLFMSISRDGDGRAPKGEATFIVSAFSDVKLWSSLTEVGYRTLKKKTLEQLLEFIHSFLGIPPEKWLHKELATPRSFAKWTGRPRGIVGGLGQNPNNFGPFGLPSRTPMNGLWLCGDSIYPGEGTAGVSQSAIMVCRQLMARWGQSFLLPM